MSGVDVRHDWPVRMVSVDRLAPGDLMAGDEWSGGDHEILAVELDEHGRSVVLTWADPGNEWRGADGTASQVFRADHLVRVRWPACARCGGFAERGSEVCEQHPADDPEPSTMVTAEQAFGDTGRCMGCHALTGDEHRDRCVILNPFADWRTAGVLSPRAEAS